jgi:glycine/D-amino acid oxidase-like deaminating enzyme
VDSPQRIPTPSFWFDQLPRRTLRAALEGRVEADVCIVGGGFTGLWTAYELRRVAPDRSVVLLEGECLGFGASGRNGGWVLGMLSGSAAAWRRRGGPGAPAVMARAIRGAVTEVADAIAREGIDCDWRQGGAVAVAQGAAQLGRLRRELENERAALGDAAAHVWLGQEQLGARIAVDGALGGLFTPHCARVQPAKLVVGLAAAAERLGARIYERSRALAIAPGRVRTIAGEVRAQQVVIATEAYTADLPGRHRSLLPMNSSMIVTEPLTEQLWSQIGWSGGETLRDAAHVYVYLQRTADGRIAIGGRGIPYRFGSRTDREGPVPRRTVEQLRGRLRALFPALGEVPVARAWHGVLGVPRDWCPTVSYDRASGIAKAGGYVGDGVAASNLAARTLTDLLLGGEGELARLPWVGESPRPWEPEPLRFLGARGIYALYRTADRQEARSGRGSGLAALADRIAGR